MCLKFCFPTKQFGRFSLKKKKKRIKSNLLFQFQKNITSIWQYTYNVYFVQTFFKSQVGSTYDPVIKRHNLQGAVITDPLIYIWTRVELKMEYFHFIKFFLKTLVEEGSIFHTDFEFFPRTITFWRATHVSCIKTWKRIHSRFIKH